MIGEIKGPILVTADLHLSERSEDSYRFNLFPWLLRLIQERGVGGLLILGDLTERKDGHPAVLVDRIVRDLSCVAEKVPVVILKGNHDYSDPACPFFGFLNLLPGVQYIRGPRVVRGLGLFLPHSRNPEEEWEKERLFFDGPIFLHQSVGGARGSNGHAVGGIPSSWFATAGGPILSGDIHVPQKVERVEYVGAPYPIYFGDDFNPRVILLRGKRALSIPCPTFARKRVLRISDPGSEALSELTGEDHVRIILSLPRSEFGSWREYRRKITERVQETGAHLYGVELHERKSSRVRLQVQADRKLSDPAEVLTAYCKHARLDDPETVKIGHALLENKE
jgi:hypothetical protein